MSALSLPGLLAPLNAQLTPLIRLGVANPLPLSTGLVVLEVRGRRTGVTREVPLIGTDWGAFVTVSTVRTESQWVRNLAANPEAELWLRGCKRPVQAEVYRNGERLDGQSDGADPSSRVVRSFSDLADMSIALLRPRRSA